VTVSCQSTETMMGGGCSAGTTSSTTMKHNYPSAVRTWYCAFSNGTAGSITAYAICCS
jgi:hypothetical protein